MQSEDSGQSLMISRPNRNSSVAKRTCSNSRLSPHLSGRRRLTLKRSEEDAALIQKLKQEDEEREKELKAKQDELDDLKTKHDKEKEEKKKLQKDLERLVSSQMDAGQKLIKTNEILDKVRIENKKKTDQIEKLQQNISYMEDRIRNLEIRASEVEKSELLLESTRKTLENSQAECRSRESEIRKITLKNEEAEKKLETADKKIQDLEKKIGDLKYQVRHELMKNENIEKGLETIPRLKEEIEEKEHTVKQTEKEIEEKSALLLAARKAVRDYKDKLREADQQLEETEVLRQELQLSKCEVTTLKRLMTGKDILVLQKCHALELAKEVIDSLNTTPVETEKIQKIQHILERLGNISVGASMERRTINGHPNVSPRPVEKVSSQRVKSSQPESSKESIIDVNIPPYSLDSGHGETDVYFERVSREGTNLGRPKTAVNVRRSTSFHEASNSRVKSVYGARPQTRSASSTDSKYKYETKTQSKHPPSLEYNLGVKQGHELENKRKPLRPYSAVVFSKMEDSESETESSTQDISDFVQKITPEQRLALSKLTAKEKDNLLSSMINIGDRLSIVVPQKPPRYGKKKVKPIVYTGIVKYKGTLDKEFDDARIYVGVRLDELIGDSDGTFKGKRYMFTPPEQAKFFKIKDVTSILNIQSGHYIPMTRMMAWHLAHPTHNHVQYTDQEPSSSEV